MMLGNKTTSHSILITAVTLNIVSLSLMAGFCMGDRYRLSDTKFGTVVIITAILLLLIKLVILYKREDIARNIPTRLLILIDVGILIITLLISILVGAVTTKLAQLELSNNNIISLGIFGLTVIRLLTPEEKVAYITDLWDMFNRNFINSISNKSIEWITLPDELLAYLMTLEVKDEILKGTRLVFAELKKAIVAQATTVTPIVEEVAPASSLFYNPWTYLYIAGGISVLLLLCTSSSVYFSRKYILTDEALGVLKKDLRDELSIELYIKLFRAIGLIEKVKSEAAATNKPISMDSIIEYVRYALAHEDDDKV